ncbi:NDP-sugar epimerase, includes UDP-GlcNAc-inverting 4,6-dehydratase FlaA1 and capsular polysaccharide biosynthesis protein EpsC [Xylanibacter ruminicola]|uniref:NDP-sugar epimerase, includes UDP-GlcNAc-inverting 4,6-dehydratase FlaA1 and capsular polysaccharide biosynthesis protein EpsC n=1 Tax=Xylanibacter ruminicola TaxID=839 RepID=A0A1H4DJA0_XYLRU|nr:nucleoside-diphosphate sugar epimerase/dehydratase [Xylanibacter ruminicola]SEA72825.1 NDP-sugar epimerase, includes UDP-GlcNAc-inverting 4,6-dehydratase FlaA1 and capsular polysaccharide biosynthesis protein EpsC [Xylanibacter ruminicola]
MNLINKLLNWYFSKKSLPYWCLFLADSMIVLVSGLLTFWAENKTLEMFYHRFEVLYSALLYVAISWIGWRLFKTYLGVVRYSSFVDLMKVAYANTLSTVIVLVVSLVLEHFGIAALCAFTKTEIIITFLVATLLMWAMRVVVKTLHDVTHNDQPLTRVLIYGAMTGGIGIAKNIRTQKPAKYLLRGFISHDKRAKNMMLLGEKVYNVDDDIAEVIEKEKIQAVLVSPLRLDDFRNNQRIQDELLHAGVKILFAQQAKEANIKNGELSEEDFAGMQLKEVSVEDLLPRQEIKVDMDSVGAMLTGKRVLITGSAGSIGSEMVRQIAIYKPAKMMLIDQAETPQHDILLMMKKDYPEIDAEIVVTSISRVTRMEAIFSTFKPDYVFHAAAYKHVPMMEPNPSEAVMNNIYGTKVIADLSVKYGVKKFVMVSTDKAVNPTNVMGCSKRICEIYVQSLNNTQKVCQFVTTRFGNVLGSNGSVIPLFKEQIKNGGPVTVTDERIVRFFMLIPEACKLVLEAGTKGNGGEIFVFDMGKPVKIIDLAKRMIALSGAKNVEIKITGLREGEKLYEEVLNELEGTKPSFHEKIRIAEVRQYDYAAVSKDIDELIAISKQYDNMKTVAKMKEIVPEYKSNNSIYEELDK